MADTSTGTRQALANQQVILNEIRENNRGTNFRFVVIIVMILIGLGTNLVRTFAAEAAVDKRQARIEFLDRRVEDLVQRNRKLREELTYLKEGTPMPQIKDR